MGELVDIGDTQLYVERRGAGYPLIVLPGGPGGDHHQFDGYLDPLTEDFLVVLVDQRAQGRSAPSPVDTWTVHRMARDISSLAAALELHRYAVLGHSFGGLVALEHAVSWPGAATQTIISHAVPSPRWYRLGEELAALEPRDLREEIAAAWEALESAASLEEALDAVVRQAPFHFREPLDPRIPAYNARIKSGSFSPEVNRHFSATGYAGFDVDTRLERIKQPVLILTGRWERTCPAEAAEFMARHIPKATLVVFERSAHMSYVEENHAYVQAVSTWLEEEVGA